MNNIEKPIVNQLKEVFDPDYIDHAMHKDGQVVKAFAERYLRRWWGKKCYNSKDEYCEHCGCCRKWKALEELLND